MKEIRKPSGGFFFFPKTKGFHIVVRLKDVPGALSDVLGVLRDHVDFTHSTTYSLGEGNAIWSGVGKSLSDDDTEAKLKELTERSPMVLECTVKESDNGLLVDSFHSGIDFGPDRPGIIFPIEGIVHVYDRLAQDFGSGAETILFEEGSALGKSSGRYLNARLSRGDLDWKVKALVDIYRAIGWGSSALEVETPGTQFRVRIEECFECTGAGKGRKGCGFLRGHLVSTVSTLSGREFRGEETKCRLRGGPFCEFLVSRRET